MTREGSRNVSDRKSLVDGEAARDPWASRALRVGKDAVELGTNLQSDNFDSGVSGWKLDRETGSLEANDGVFRGQVTIGSGTDFDAGYDPTTYETPAGAQARADAAYEDARDPANWVTGVIPGAIQISGNYTAGTSGWAIDGAGNVEFNSATVRGDLIAGGGAIEVSSVGIFIEEGAAAVNNVRFGPDTTNIRASIGKKVGQPLAIAGTEGVLLSAPFPGTFLALSGVEQPTANGSPILTEATLPRGSVQKKRTLTTAVAFDSTFYNVSWNAVTVSGDFSASDWGGIGTGLTIPVDGIYTITFQTRFDDVDTAGRLIARLTLSGATLSRQEFASCSTVVFGPHASAVGHFNAGDVIDAEMWQNSGVTNSVEETTIEAALITAD